MSVIAILGGGVYVPRLCELFAAAIPGCELRLWARRPERLRTIANGAATTIGRPVVVAETLAEAARGADIVVPLVRIGGFDARAHDEGFPTEFGLVGDEGIGAGGLANAFRSVPALAEMATTLAEVCPNAWVCNMVAPLGITTRVFLAAGLRAVGLCELPTLTLEAWTERPYGSVPFEYAGLNHLGWFWGLAEDVVARAATRGFVDEATRARFGAAPLRYYYEVIEPAAGERLGIRRRLGRAQQLSELADVALEGFAGDPSAGTDPLAARPTPWFDRTLVPSVVALLGGPPHDGFVNVSNAFDGEPFLPTLPRDVVVELPAHITTAITPRRCAPPPPGVRTFLERAAAAEDLAYDAARARSVDALARALAALPLAIAQDVLPRLAERAAAL